MKKTDKINKDVIKQFNPCNDRFQNYLNHYESFNGDLFDFINLEQITYSDKVWVFTKLFTYRQNVLWSVLCASKVLSNFESLYPDDKRPRQAIEAAYKFYLDPSEKNRSAAESAARSAAWSAWSAAESAAESARSAARSARSAAWSAWSAAESAAESARSAARSARSAAWSACSAAESAVESARSAARSAAEKLEEEINLLLALECLE